MDELRRLQEEFQRAQLDDADDNDTATKPADALLPPTAASAPSSGAITTAGAAAGAAAAAAATSAGAPVAPVGAELARGAAGRRRLGERHVVDLVAKLRERGLLDGLLSSADGRVFITADRLVRDLRDELLARGGKSRCGDGCCPDCTGALL